MSLWLLRFRYIAPYDYHTPYLHIPLEGTRVEGETKEEAWQNFLKGATHPDYLRLEEAMEV
jgi:hypothetical protein